MSHTMLLENTTAARTCVATEDFAGLMNLLGAVEDARFEYEIERANDAVALRQDDEAGEILARYADALR